MGFSENIGSNVGQMFFFLVDSFFFLLKQHNFGFVLSGSKNFGHRFGSSIDLLGRGPRKNCKNDLDDQT